MAYHIEISHEFCAAHALSIAGHEESTHGHNFRILATIAGDQLDDDGLLCDFHTAEEALQDICGAFNNRDLNAVEPFHRVNPSAENLARHIAEELADRLDESLAPAARVHSVSVTEAPGCRAVFVRG